MNFHCVSLILLIWIFAAVPLGFTDPFPDRPAQTGLEAAVTLGTDCGLGVYERSLAVQVAPPAGQPRTIMPTTIWTD